jgi:hypothetical protein
MFKTGNTSADYFLLGVTFLPLLPVILIFLRKVYVKEQLTFLMIVCLLNFIGSLIREESLLDPSKQSIVNNLFSLLELIAITQLFKPALNARTKDLFSIFMISSLSVLLTYFSLKGWATSSIGLDTLQNGIIVGVILLSLPPLVRSIALRIFEFPLFWIAAGTLFYFSIFILLEWVDGPLLSRGGSPGGSLAGSSAGGLVGSPDTEKMIFLAIAALIRYLLYCFAVLCCRPAGAPARPEDD